MRGLKSIYCNSEYMSASIGFPSDAAVSDLVLENLLVCPSVPFQPANSCTLEYRVPWQIGLTFEVMLYHVMLSSPDAIPCFL
jgi:hypothetical protein